MIDYEVGSLLFPEISTSSACFFHGKVSELHPKKSLMERETASKKWIGM